jgi:collagen triple helix repeat protein
MADDRDPVNSGESSRRAFIQRMLVAGFAAPVIGSFSFSELAAASEQRHTFPCQYHPNQTQTKCDNDDDDDHGKDQGDKGDQGDQGNKGDPGNQGNKGDQGNQGNKGDQGNKGKDHHDEHHHHHG